MVTFDVIKNPKKEGGLKAININIMGSSLDDCGDINWSIKFEDNKKVSEKTEMIEEGEINGNR